MYPSQPVIEEMVEDHPLTRSSVLDSRPLTRGSPIDSRLLTRGSSRQKAYSAPVPLEFGDHCGVQANVEAEGNAVALDVEPNLSAGNFCT